MVLLLSEKKPRGASTKTKGIILTIIIVAIAAAGGYYYLGGQPGLVGPPPVTKDVIKVGFTLSFSGSASYEAEDELRGISLWADDVNSRGGISVKEFGKNLKVQLVYYDDQSKPDLAVSLYDKLINEDKVDILLGTSVSLTSGPAATVAAKYNKFFLAPQAANPTIYRQGYATVLGTMPLVDDFTGPIFPFLASEGIKKVALLYDQSIDLWVSAYKSDVNKIKANNLEAVFVQGYPKDTDNFVPLLQQAKASGADVLIVEDYMVPNVLNIVKQGQASGAKFKVFFNAYVGASFTQFANGVGDLTTYNFGTTQWLPTVKYKANTGFDSDTYLRKIKEKHGQDYAPGAFAATEYVTGVLLEKIITTAGTLKTEDLVSTALSLSGKVTTLIGTTIWEKTATGIEQRGNSWIVVQVQPGGPKGYHLEIVWPPEVRTAKSVFPP